MRSLENGSSKRMFSAVFATLTPDEATLKKPLCDFDPHLTSQFPNLLSKTSEIAKLVIARGWDALDNLLPHKLTTTLGANLCLLRPRIDNLAPLNSGLSAPSTS